MERGKIPSDLSALESSTLNVSGMSQADDSSDTIIAPLPPDLGITKAYKVEIIPIIKTKNFEKLPTETLAYLFEVIFPSGKKFLDDRVEETTSTMMT